MNMESTRPVTTKSYNKIGVTSIPRTVGVATTTTEDLILSSRAPEVSQSDPLQPVTAVEGILKLYMIVFLYCYYNNIMMDIIITINH